MVNKIFFRKISKTKGFTLIELIIVIAVIALLAAAVFVAVDPAKRIGSARDAQRWADVTAVADAILKYIVDNSGTFPTSTATFTAGEYHEIYSYGSEAGPASGTGSCNALTRAGLTVQTDFIQLDNLVATYLPTMPEDPGRTGEGTGYYFMRSSAGRVTIGACDESDYATASITVTR